MALATKSMTFSVRKSMADRLMKYSSKTGITRSKVLDNALNNFFLELDEDAKDLADAKRIMNEVKVGKQKLISAEEVYKKAGL